MNNTNMQHPQNCASQFEWAEEKDYRETMASSLVFPLVSSVNISWKLGRNEDSQQK
jgi:hypothetical protein